jgi:hypothetical protein
MKKGDYNSILKYHTIALIAYPRPYSLNVFKIHYPGGNLPVNTFAPMRENVFWANVRRENVSRENVSAVKCPSGK